MKKSTVAQAQQTGKVPRIGFLDSGNASDSTVLVKAFVEELNQLGWIEGKNLTIEYRFLSLKFKLLHATNAQALGGF